MTNDTTRPLALVTGASSGIGESYADALAARGYDLILVARRGDRLKAVADRLSATGAAVETVIADLATDAGTIKVRDVCRARALALLVNNAGVAHYARFVAVDPDRADEVVRVNALAAVALARAAVGGMVERKRGAIVNVSSLLAFSGPVKNPQMPARAVYAATKAFLVAFTQVLAMELEGTGVKVQVVCPGVVASEFHTAQGMDPSKLPPRLSSADLVKGSLADLDAGIVVSIPTLEEQGAFGAIEAAQGALLGQSLRSTLAKRYGS
jgi:short-subunit dehydrogenase